MPVAEEIDRFHTFLDGQIHAYQRLSGFLACDMGSYRYIPIVGQRFDRDWNLGIVNFLAFYTLNPELLHVGLMQQILLGLWTVIQFVTARVGFHVDDFDVVGGVSQHRSVIINTPVDQ